MKPRIAWAFMSASLFLPAAGPAETARTIDDVRGGARSFQLEEIETSACDMRALTPLARTALSMEDMKWRHAQTEHFVLHYEREILARKVGRMAEFFYAHIAGELKAEKDLVDGRSHIFIFRDTADYRRFMALANTEVEWAYSFVQGTAMFLQPEDDTRESGGLLAHEMTHVVLNRFFSGRPPIWLNEGLAEWFEEFGYAAFKGTKKSRRSQFRDLNHRIPLEVLIEMTSHPQKEDEIYAFYETSKFLVGYLLLEHNPGKIIPFTEDIVAGMGSPAALFKHYGIDSVDVLEKEFERFVK